MGRQMARRLCFPEHLCWAQPCAAMTVYALSTDGTNRVKSDGRSDVLGAVGDAGLQFLRCNGDVRCGRRDGHEAIVVSRHRRGKS